MDIMTEDQIIKKLIENDGYEKVFLKVRAIDDVITIFDKMGLSYSLDTGPDFGFLFHGVYQGSRLSGIAIVKDQILSGL